MGSGYHKLRVRGVDIPNTNFSNRYCHFEFFLMSSSLTYDLTTFIHLMNLIFRSYLDSIVIVFIDYMLIYSISDHDHMHHLRIVSEVLKDNQQFAKFGKYEFRLRSIAFICHIVSSEV